MDRGWGNEKKRWTRGGKIKKEEMNWGWGNETRREMERNGKERKEMEAKTKRRIRKGRNRKETGKCRDADAKK